MKKSCLYLMAVMALASITSCRNDSEDFQKPSDEIRLTSEISPTRVTSQDRLRASVPTRLPIIGKNWTW